MTKTVKASKDGFDFVFRFDGKDVLVKGYQDGEEVLDWAYFKAPGVGRSLEAQAAFWLEQAAMQARASGRTR